jgi:hypothetical protein
VTKTDLDAVVADYLRRLDAALARRQVPDRDQLVTEISEHLNQARSQLPDQTEANLRDLLDRVGSPEEIAEEAALDQSAQSGTHRRRWLMAGAVALVLIVLGTALGLAVSSSGSGSHPPATTPAPPTTAVHRLDTTQVPQLTGLSEGAARGGIANDRIDNHDATGPQ